MTIKRNKIIRIFAKLLGILLLFTGMRMIGEGFYNLINEHTQQDWIQTNAYVIHCSGEYTRSLNNRKLHYNIIYEYTVDGETYSRTLSNRHKPLSDGDIIKIKYNPDSHNESNEILSPSITNLLIFILFGCIFSAMGFFFSGAYTLIRKIRKNKKE